MPRLAGRDSVSAKTLLFTILTASRTGEVIGGTWSEIDGDLWTIPAGRMKAGKIHQVPLVPAVLGLLVKLTSNSAADMP